MPWNPLDPSTDDGITLATQLNEAIPPLEEAVENMVTLGQTDARYLRKDQDDESIGNLSIRKGDPRLMLNKTGVEQSASIWGISGDTVRWIVALGDSEPESTADAGSDFSILRYDDAGNLLGQAMTIDRATGQVLIGGNLTISKSSPLFNFNKSGSGQAAGFFGMTANVVRWGFQLGNANAEGGGNSGSDFSIDRYNDAGAYLGTPLAISRATGAATMEGLVIGRRANPAIMLDKSSGGNQIAGWSNGVGRWQMFLGNNAAETGANAGSDFTINRYADNGTFVDTPVQINRATGVVEFSVPPMVDGQPVGGGKTTRIWGYWSSIQNAGYPNGADGIAYAQHDAFAHIWTAYFDESFSTTNYAVLIHCLTTTITSITRYVDRIEINLLVDQDTTPSLSIEILHVEPADPPSEALFTTPGTVDWVVPAGVISISAVAVAAGGGSHHVGTSGYFGGGGGGALSYSNDLPVTPGETLSIVVPGTAALNMSGGRASLSRGGVELLAAEGGRVSNVGTGGIGGQAANGVGQVRFSGGNGADQFSNFQGGGGGGAAGYQGNGGNGANTSGSSGVGGSGGGGASNGGGGGVGLDGRGNNGSAPGGGGSKGLNASGRTGGNFGGGSGGAAFNNNTGAIGAQGAVRIIWGAGSSFPFRAGY